MIAFAWVRDLGGVAVIGAMFVALAVALPTLERLQTYRAVVIALGVIVLVMGLLTWAGVEVST